MLDILKPLADKISEVYPSLVVKEAFDSAFMCRPLTCRSVFLTLGDNDFTSHESAVSVLIYVYSPVKLGGEECLLLAEKISSLISEMNDDIIVQSVGRVVYNNDSNAFTVKIGCGIYDSSGSFGQKEVIYRLVACDFESDEEAIISFTCRGFSVKTEASGYPILTICDSEPLSIVNRSTDHTITLSGVALDESFPKGKFTLHIGSGESEQIYKECCLKSVSMSGSDKTMILTAQEKEEDI